MANTRPPVRASGFVRSVTGEVVYRVTNEHAKALNSLEATDSADFRKLVRAAKLDPRQDFVGRDLSNMPFGASKSDLRGFNFRDADLRGTQVSSAILDENTDFTGARLDPVDADIIRQRFPGPPPPDFDLGAVHEMILRSILPPTEWLPWIKEIDFARFLPKPRSSHYLADILNDQININNKIFLSNEENIGKNHNTVYISENSKFVNTNISEKFIVGMKKFNSNITIINSRDSLINQINELESGIFNAIINQIDVSLINICFNLISINLSGSKINDVLFLNNLEFLREIDISGTNITDISPLRSLPDLIHVKVESLGRARALARTLGKSGVVTTKDFSERGKPHIRPLKSGKSAKGSEK